MDLTAIAALISSVGTLLLILVNGWQLHTNNQNLQREREFRLLEERQKFELQRHADDFEASKNSYIEAYQNTLFYISQLETIKTIVSTTPDERTNQNFKLQGDLKAEVIKWGGLLIASVKKISPEEAQKIYPWYSSFNLTFPHTNDALHGLQRSILDLGIPQELFQYQPPLVAPSIQITKSPTQPSLPNLNDGRKLQG